MSSGPELHLLLPGPLDQRTGGYLYNSRMVDGLRRQGWTVTVHGLEGSFPDADEEAGESVVGALATLPDGVRVLVDSLALPAASPSLSAHSNRLRPLGLIHHLTSEETRINKILIRSLRLREVEALASCLGVIVTSGFTASRVERLGVPSALIRAVEPGIEPAPPARGPDSGEPARLLCVGSIIPRKGQDTLVQALALLREHSWTCVLAGSLNRDSGFADAVRQLTKEEGLDERVHFVGECGEAELEQLYDRASVFVLPSHYEGFGIAIAEALSRGLPVISTTGGAIPYTVPWNAGILVRPGHHQALAEAIASLLTDSAPNGDSGVSGSITRRRAELAAAARDHAETLPDWDQQARQFADTILSLTPERA